MLLTCVSPSGAFVTHLHRFPGLPPWVKLYCPCGTPRNKQLAHYGFSLNHAAYLPVSYNSCSRVNEMIHRFVNHNGQVLPVEEARLSPGQAGLLSGWGLFTTLRVFHGEPFAFERHWRRLEKDAGRTR